MIGIDLSLTGTGIFEGDRPKTITPTLVGRQRREYIHEIVMHDCEHHGAVCIEGLAFSARDAYQERAGLWWRIVDDLERKGKRVWVCPPTALKKFVAGAGNAEKSMMILNVYKRWGISASNDNEADAVGLFRLGLCLSGAAQPETQAQREVVAGILTPKVKKAKKGAA